MIVHAGGPKRILVAVDDTAGSLRAAMFARDLARAFRADLTLLNVIEPLPLEPLSAFGVPPSQVHDKQLADAQQFLKTLVADLGVEGAEQVIELGAPAELICDHAEERDVDLIVLGAHGHGHVARMLLGSVGARVAALSGRSVAIIR